MADDDTPDFDPDDTPDFGTHESLGNIAQMGMTVYRALKRDGASEAEAFSVTAAFFAGVTKAMYEDDGD